MAVTACTLGPPDSSEPQAGVLKSDKLRARLRFVSSKLDFPSTSTLSGFSIERTHEYSRSASFGFTV